VFFLDFYLYRTYQPVTSPPLALRLTLAYRYRNSPIIEEQILPRPRIHPSGGTSQCCVPRPGFGIWV
jgi:hypothetical protein